MDVVKKIVSEPGESSPADYSRRVHRLAALYPAIFVLALAGEILLFARGQAEVTVDLERGETTAARARVEAPPGEYQAEVEVHYPPR